MQPSSSRAGMTIERSRRGVAEGFGAMIRMRQRLRRVISSQPGWVSACCFISSRTEARGVAGAPIPVQRGASGIQNHPGDVKWAGLKLRLDAMGAQFPGAPAAQLRKGHGIFHTPREVLDGGDRALGLAHLADQEGDDIPGMHAIPDLVAGAVEADVL